ncbi:peroxisomal biogenesis factor 19 [Fusarium pseudoanthophilum]|uniref:Peroxisomal biogenesis factor 19 n=1 Tax=Fusarium pseudoanthophilum TaxID=48495 RepID=A0A8H5UIX3_9HYPO|nr:peroxisomal biogenesis factor 19 [Fusarium pseudoanthophilum]
MGVDKDTEVALKEEVTEGLKEAAQEGVKDEVKEDKKDEIEDTTDLKTEAEADADAAASSHTLMPDAPTAHAAATSPATPSLDSNPQNSALHEASAEETAPDDAVPQESSSKAAPQQPDPQEAAATTEAVAEKTDALPTPAPKAAVTVDEIDEVPDPDEDDLDDLDDMLEEFSAVKLDQTKPPGAASAGSSKPEAPKGSASGKQPEVEDAFSEDEFARQLQAGMADLLGELEQSPDMQAQFEDIFKHIAAAEGAGDAPPPSTSKGPSSQAPPEDASFQDTIKRTMERMQASGDQATAAAASGSADDFMSEMLKQLSSGDLGDLGGDGSEEEFSKMLMGMMEQLTNKEILYEPMKELDEKFPEWLIKNRDSTPKDDLKRYEEQQSIVREIVAKFEEKTYSDSNAADREFIVDKMQKMQAAGSPPSDLVGDMQSAQDALNPGDEACNPQ